MDLEKDKGLRTVRQTWESSLTPLVVIDQRVTHRRVLVILQKNDVYHLHRYVYLGDMWDVSCDGQGVPLESVWTWLNYPKALPR